MSGVVVRVRFGSRRQLRHAFQRELAHGRLFVRTRSPLAVGAFVPIVLELHDGQAIDVQGEVAAARLLSEATPAAPAGMEVKLLDFTPAKRGRIEELMRREQTHVPVPSVTGAEPSFEQLIRVLRRLVFLGGEAAVLRAADAYELLGVSPSASTAEIRDACGVLRALLDPNAPPDGVRLSPERQERIAELFLLVVEIEGTLTDAARRADYDLRRAGVTA